MCLVLYHSYRFCVDFKNIGFVGFMLALGPHNTDSHKEETYDMKITILRLNYHETDISVGSSLKIELFAAT